MRLVHVATVMTATIVGASIMLFASTADAARFCRCLDINNSGTCLRYGDCREVEASFPGFRQFRSGKECRRSQAILCDYTSCQTGCNLDKK